jgi:hypothetical protein
MKAIKDDGEGEKKVAVGASIKRMGGQQGREEVQEMEPSIRTSRRHRVEHDI